MGEKAIRSFKVLDKNKKNEKKNPDFFSKRNSGPCKKYRNIQLVEVPFSGAVNFAWYPTQKPWRSRSGTQAQFHLCYFVSGRTCSLFDLRLPQVWNGANADLIQQL